MELYSALERQGKIDIKLSSEDVERINVSSFNTADIPVVQARLSARGADLSESYPLLEAHILDPLRRIPGVARVDLDGVEPRQVYVDLIAFLLDANAFPTGDEELTADESVLRAILIKGKPR